MTSYRNWKKSDKGEIAQFWKRLNASPADGKRKDFSEKYLSEGETECPEQKHTIDSK